MIRPAWRQRHAQSCPAQLRSVNRCCIRVPLAARVHNFCDLNLRIDDLRRKFVRVDRRNQCVISARRTSQWHRGPKLDPQKRPRPGPLQYFCTSSDDKSVCNVASNFLVDAGVSEIPAWPFLDAIPMATRCGALDAVALADFSTAKTNAIAPQCVGGIGLQGALAQKGMTVVAKSWQRTPSKLQRFSWRFSRCSVRHEYARDANSEGEHHA